MSALFHSAFGCSAFACDPELVERNAVLFTSYTRLTQLDGIVGLQCFGREMINLGETICALLEHSVDGVVACFEFAGASNS